MTLYQNKYRVESTRLKNYDYSSNGVYCITICTQNRECHFGHIRDYQMRLSISGNIAVKYWEEIPKHFQFISLDEFVVMPNHIHGIIIIDQTKLNNNTHDGRDVAMQRLYAGNNPKMSKISPKSGSLASAIRSYKSICTKTINQQIPNNNFHWQTRYYDQILNNKKSLYDVRQYILNNVINWEDDSLFLE